MHCRNDVFEVIQRLRNGSLDGYDERRVKGMVTVAQQFAFKYTTMRARHLYWRRALERYTALWSDMGDLVQRVVGELRTQGRLPS
jgi:hypothetical protein